MRKIQLLTLVSLAACATAGRTPPATNVSDAPPPASTNAPTEPQAEPAAKLAGAVVSLGDAPTFVAGSGKAWITKLAQGEGAFVGLLELDPNAAVPEHQDATDEYIYVLSGSGTITLAGTSHEVGAESLIFMPAGISAAYQNGDEKLVALQVFAGPAPAAKYDSWAQEEEPAEAPAAP